MEPTIIIDAGHGGWDNGASYNGRLEKDDNLRLALAVGNKLEQDGYPVFYTRTNDMYQRPVDKAMIANASGGDYFVSFHRNAAASPNLYNGVQTLVFNDSGINKVLADNVNQKMVGVGFKDLGVEERKNLAVLRRTKMPAILIEAGFIDSDKDNQLFDNNFDELVNAIATGIEQSVGAKGNNDPAPPAIQYGVQTGLYRRVENARYALMELINRGYDAEIIEKPPYYAVVVGDEANIDSARKLEQQLIKDGYNTLIINRG